MTALLERLEGAREGSRELGHEVLLHFGWHRSLVGHFYGPLYQWSAPDRKPCLISGDEDKLPNPVLSIDAALALAERVLPGCEWEVIKLDNVCIARLGDPSVCMEGEAATPALAICIAVLNVPALIRATAKEGAGG